jgi:hypothetical protein
MPELEHDFLIVWPSYNKSFGADRARRTRIPLDFVLMSL